MLMLTNLITTISSPEFSTMRTWIIIACIALITFLLSVLTNYLMSRSFKLFTHYRHADYEPRNEKTKFVVARRLFVLLIYIVGIAVIIYVIPELRSISYSLFAGAGILAIIVGFAAQKAFANIMSGIFLAISQPIRVGDKVTINNHFGTVDDITLRHTVIKTWDDNRVIIPNSNINEAEILNHSIEDEAFLQTLEMGISYDSNIETARKIMVEEVFQHPSFTPIQRAGDYLPSKELAKVRVTDLGDFAVKLKLYFWVKNKTTGFLMSCDLRETIKNKFDEQGVEIPFPYRTIVYKKDIKKKIIKKTKKNKK